MAALTIMDVDIYAVGPWRAGLNSLSGQPKQYQQNHSHFQCLVGRRNKSEQGPLLLPMLLPLLG